MTGYIHNSFTTEHLDRLRERAEREEDLFPETVEKLPASRVPTIFAVAGLKTDRRRRSKSQDEWQAEGVIDTY